MSATMTVSETAPTNGASAATPQVEQKEEPFSQRHKPGAKSTQGTMRFFGGTTDGQPPFLDFSPEAPVKSNAKDNLMVRKTFYDLRSFDPPATMQRELCAVALDAPTALTEAQVRGPDAKGIIEGAYFAECAALARRYTGAAEAVAYKYRHRETGRHDADPYGASYVEAKPILYVHIDNSAASAREMLRRAVGGDAAALARWEAGHWAIVNVWRPLGVPAARLPLAVVDPRTVDAARDVEVIEFRHNYKDAGRVVRDHPDLRAYYASNLQPHEALLFCDYDSRKNFGFPHSAFEDDVSSVFRALSVVASPFPFPPAPSLTFYCCPLSKLTPAGLSPHDRPPPLMPLPGDPLKCVCCAGSTTRCGLDLRSLFWHSQGSMWSMVAVD